MVRGLLVVALCLGVGALAGVALAAPADAPEAGVSQEFRRWLPLALRGDADAQLNLARVYARGARRTQDLAEAAHWYRKAAEQGDARAQHALGALYHKGRGVTQDYVQAYVWFDRAAARLVTGPRHDQALELRDVMAAFMTPEQRAEAARLLAGER